MWSLYALFGIFIIFFPMLASPGKNTMKYVEEMNRANIDGGKVTMHETVTGKKNTMGMTKQWQTLESIAL